MRQSRLLIRGSLAFAGLVVLAGSGCAHDRAVAAQGGIATGRYAIRNADRNNGNQYAPEQLAAARSKLSEAELALEDGYFTSAILLAEEATVEAQLVKAIAARDEARAQRAEAKKVKQDASELRTMTTEAAEERRR